MIKEDDKGKKKGKRNIRDIMALVCRHDIPLFFANIDTTGEQQKYAVALLEHIFTLLPESATVIAYYDVACVLSQSLESVRIPFLWESFC